MIEPPISVSREIYTVLSDGEVTVIFDTMSLKIQKVSGLSISHRDQLKDIIESIGVSEAGDVEAVASRRLKVTAGTAELGPR
jgi:hypothetical protein